MRILKRLIITLAVLVFSACQSVPASAPIEKKLRAYASIEDFMSIRAATMPQVSEDGAIYFKNWPTGVDQLYRLKNDETVALTAESQFPEGIDFFTVSPNGRLIVIGADVGGDEQMDLYLLDSVDPKATPKRIDFGREVRADAVVWAGDSSFFLYRSTRRNGKDFDIWGYRVGDEMPALLKEMSGYIWIGDIAPDSKSAALVRYHGGDLSDLLLLDLESLEVSQLSPPQREGGLYLAPRFSEDGKAIFIITNDGLEFTTLARMMLPSGSWTAITDIRWDIEELVISPDRQALSYTYNEHGYSRLVVLDAKTLEIRYQPAIEQGVVSFMNQGNKQLAFIFADAVQPGNVWTMDLADGQLTMQTPSEYGNVDPSRFIRPDLVFYPTFDNRKIPAYLYKPKGYGDRPAPFIIYAHGGPEAQFRPGFIRNFQYLLERGIGVLAPNIRGSAGYGKSYLQLDNQEKRMDAIKDIKAAVDWLISEGKGDPKRIGISGGSYGGWVVMAAITEYPETFASAVDSVGVVNFETFFKNTKGYRRKVREAEYGSMENVELLRRISPIHKIDHVVTPLMIVHGENDPRVPVSEARQIIEALTARGQVVKALIFPDEGHGITKLENRLVFYRQMVDFLAEHLKPDPDSLAEK